ncbi:MAG: GNAT family N-acetyltransferase [Pseudomonadota bacterium]|nr:GNAT family N-acetyltransferase [Pseudomonadota bacterium]
MATYGLQLFKRHRSALPWLLLKKGMSGVVTIETLVVFDVELETWTRHEHRESPGLMLCRITDSESPVFAQLCTKYPNKDFRERYVMRQRECYVALRNGEIAGYAWVSADSLHVDEIACTFPLAADEVFIYDCFVDEAFRGGGIYPAMLRAALDDCAAQKGIRRAVIGAVSVNHASLRGIRKAGFRERKRIHYLQCGPLQRWWGLDPVTARADAI